MSETTLCPKCGHPLPADALAGLCPKCLVAAALESEHQGAPTASSGGISKFEPAIAADLAGKFPQLEILELLGRGGMGAVYKARQRGLDRLVAVKVLPPEIGRDAAFAERFAREAKALAKLSHNHIVSVFDFGQADGLFYIVMEYVDGVNLRQTIQTGKLTPAEALAIVPQICEALQFAHDEGIVHRDIKPENILIDKRGRVKIADFGLAKLMASGGDASPDASLTATHQIMGTLRYMAPEQMQGTREVDHRADIYSLGVIFYELLTGELPMGRFAPPSKKVQIDVRLDEIVLRTLEQDPEQRYQHASQVKTDVEAIPRDAKPAMTAAPTTAPDGIVFRRLSVFNLLFWLVWSALLAGLQWGYLSETKWYFQKELPYNYLSGGWNLVSVMFAFFFVYWWYLLAKSPEKERSFQDAWRTMQSPDRRALRVWLPAGTYLAIWIIATILTMSFANDDVQSTTLTALFIAAPLVAMGSCLWAYGQRVHELLRDQGQVMQNRPMLSREPRFSRFAIAGAVWALFGVLAILPTLFFISLNRVWNGTALPTDLVHEEPPLLFTIFMGALLAIGAGAPIGTTIFGALSIGHIKRSAGRITGLPLAVADALIFPLLALGGIIAFLVAKAFTLLAPHPNAAAVVSAASFGALVAIVVCFFVARVVWCAVAGIPKARTPKKPWRRHLRWVLAPILLVLACGVGWIQRNPLRFASQASALLPPETITSGFGVNFIVPAGHVAVFEIVTRRDNATMPVPPHCGYVMASQGTPVAGTFRWSRMAEDAVADHGRRRWSLEIRTDKAGGGRAEGNLLPEGLDSAVGAGSLGLGDLEPNEEVVHWFGDADNLPANGLIGLRLTVVPHGLNRSGTGLGNIDWKKPPPSSTTRRKLDL